MAEDGRFDDLLLGLARQHQSVEDLTYSVLSFFERRTDLFHVLEGPTGPMGFRPGAAEQMFFKHFHLCQHRYLAKNQPHLLKRGSEAAGGSSSSTAPVEAPPAAAAQPPVAAAAVASSAEGKAPEAAEGGALPEQTRKMMRHISTWNGSVTDKYHWSQSLQEVTVEIEVEPSRAADIKVDITATRLTVKCKGNTVLEGKLHDRVVTDQTLWHLESEKFVVLSMEKQRETWWKCVLEGDEEIDTTKVESTRKIDEYDGETQGAIRKIMFDQHQKLKGEASSDQIRTAEMMREAWNAPGSPFRGTDFDPTMLNLSSAVPDEFFAEMEKKRIEEARKAKGLSGPP